MIVPAADFQAFAAANNVIDGLVPVSQPLVGIVLQLHRLQRERRDGPFGQVVQPIVDDLAAQEALHAVHQGGLLLLVGGIFLFGALGGGSQLAGQIGAVSAEHLIVCPDEGIASMAKGGTIACLLPATSFYLGATFAPAKKMIEAGVPVAIATDFNPGSTPNLSLQLAMNIACYRYRMTPEETLTAATLNAAAAIGRADRVGTVETGKQADLLLWDADNLNYIFYRYGSNLVKTVVKAGQVVKQN